MELLRNAGFDAALTTPSGNVFVRSWKNRAMYSDEIDSQLYHAGIDPLKFRHISANGGIVLKAK